MSDSQWQLPHHLRGNVNNPFFSGGGVGDSDLFLDALLSFLQCLSSLYYLNSSTYFPFLFLHPLENSTSQTRRKHMNTLIGGTKKKTKPASTFTWQCGPKD